MGSSAAARIAYFVHGRGRGHASRALDVVPALRSAGHSIALFASGDALLPLSTLGSVTERPLLRGGLVGHAHTLASAVLASAQIRDARADLVISDGDAAALLAARARGVRSLALGHDLVFSCCELPPGLGLGNIVHQRLNALVATHLSDRRVAVNFLPLPVGRAHTRLARPAVDELAPRAGQRTARAVAYFRDDNGARVVSMAGEVVSQLDVFGGHGELLPRSSFRALLGAAGAAIGSAGSNFLAECAAAGTPVLALYRRDDAEQEINARLVAAAGLGAASSFEALTTARVAEFWERARRGGFAACGGLWSMDALEPAVLGAVHELTS
jgi:UDP-N-acetylglucosamine--N-acetylmuramyl-(pentapeptide) pyrophosphoryl-undecaprenol N-acetylglucosamine transferase